MTKALKRCLSMISKILSMKTIINELNFLKRTVPFIETLEKKKTKQDLLLLAKKC